MKHHFEQHLIGHARAIRNILIVEMAFWKCSNNNINSIPERDRQALSGRDRRTMRGRVDKPIVHEPEQIIKRRLGHPTKQNRKRCEFEIVRLFSAISMKCLVATSPEVLKVVLGVGLPELLYKMVELAGHFSLVEDVAHIHCTPPPALYSAPQEHRCYFFSLFERLRSC